MCNIKSVVLQEPSMSLGYGDRSTTVGAHQRTQPPAVQAVLEPSVSPGTADITGPVEEGWATFD